VSVAILRDDLFLSHDPGEGHPESPARLRAIHASLDRDPVPGTVLVAPRAATREEILRVHAPAHLDAIARTAGRPRVWLDADTRTSETSYEAALRAAGATIEGVERVLAGEATGAFALVRPPGHHAEAARAMGFCLFNNVAIAAAHAVEAKGLRRVLVLDPDVHHGNGTQHAFWTRDDVLYVSSHRYPFYPGTGAYDEVGEGPGRGATVNLPLPAGAGDADFLFLYQEVAEPVVRAFEPELILVSAGFDTWRDDPIGGMAQTERGFAALYALFRRWADEHCPGRLVMVLEGGYDGAGLVAGVRAALGAMTAAAAPSVEVEGRASAIARGVAGAVRRALAGTR